MSKILKSQLIESIVYKKIGSVAPTVTDDINSDYGKSDLWLDTSTNIAYVCLDNAVGAAIWHDFSTNTHNYSGHVDGGLISINADTTKFDRQSGKGYIIDNSDPDNKIITPVVWGDELGITATFLTVDAGTFIGVDINGNTIQQIEDFRPGQPYTLRNTIRLGRISHFNKTIIDKAYNYPYHFLSCDIDYACCTIVKGTVHGEGCEISNNGANLKLDFATWLSRRIGANYLTDPNAPNTPIVTGVSQFIFRMAYNSASNTTILGAATTDIDPTMLDDGTGSLIPLAVNQYTILEVEMYPNNTEYTSIIMYGQEAFNTLSSAEEALSTYRAKINRDISGGSARTLILVKQSATDLDVEVAAGRCRFIQLTAEGASVVGVGVNYWGSTGLQLQPKTITYNIYTEGYFNTTTTYRVGGTDINIAGTLSNVAYKDQDNTFSVTQTYATHPTFTIDTELVDKKYTDDLVAASTYWNKVGAILSPKTAGDDITTSGDIAGADLYITDLNTSIVESYLDSALLCGFVDRDDSTLSFDVVTRTLTIAPAITSFDIYEGGKKYTKSSPENIVISSGEGFHTIYYLNGVLTELYPYNEDVFKDVVINHASVCYIYYDSTNIDHILFEERHGLILDGANHWYLHNTQGAKYLSGYALSDFVIGDGSLDSHAQFTIESGVIADEDLETTSNQILSTSGTRVLYSTTTPGVWRWQYNPGFNVLTAGTGRLAWDNNGVFMEANNLYYVCYHTYAWNNYSGDPVNFVGQNQYATAKAAREGALTEVNNINHSGLPTPEMHAVSTVILQTKDSYANAVKSKIILPDSAKPTDYYIDWTKTDLNPSSSVTDHNNLGGLTDGDPHSQYLYLLGRSGGQSIYGGTDPSDNLTFYTTQDATKGNYVFPELVDGIIKSSVGVITGGNSVDLTSEVTGILPTANGGSFLQRIGIDLSSNISGDNIDLGTGGLKDNDATIAIYLADSSNISFNTTNKTIIGSVNELNTTVNSLTTSYSRRTAVIDYVDNTAIPPTEISGDRYILDFTVGTIHANWDGASKGDIVEFDGSVWNSTTPIEGYVAYVDNKNKDILYVDDGTPDWELRNIAITNHNDLSAIQGGTTNEYYHFTSSEHSELSNWLDNVTLLTDGTVNIGIGATYQLNGTDINTTGALTNVAYKAQDNVFSATQTYTSHPSFTIDTEMVDKKYVDDSLAGSGYWSKTLTVLSPKTSGDSVDLGTSSITAGSHLVSTHRLNVDAKSNHFVVGNTHASYSTITSAIAGIGGSTQTNPYLITLSNQKFSESADLYTGLKHHVGIIGKITTLDGAMSVYDNISVDVFAFELNNENGFYLKNASSTSSAYIRTDYMSSENFASCIVTAGGLVSGSVNNVSLNKANFIGNSLGGTTKSNICLNVNNVDMDISAGNCLYATTLGIGKIDTFANRVVSNTSGTYDSSCLLTSTSAGAKNRAFINYVSVDTLISNSSNSDVYLTANEAIGDISESIGDNYVNTNSLSCDYTLSSSGSSIYSRTGLLNGDLTVSAGSAYFSPNNHVGDIVMTAGSSYFKSGKQTGAITLSGSATNLYKTGGSLVGNIGVSGTGARMYGTYSNITGNISVTASSGITSYINAGYCSGSITRTNASNLMGIIGNSTNLEVYTSTGHMKLMARGASTSGAGMIFQGPTTAGLADIYFDRTSRDLDIHLSANSSLYEFRVYNSYSGQSMKIYNDALAASNGTVYANSGILTRTNPSDERLKDNIVPISCVGEAEKFLQVSINDFEFVMQTEYIIKDDNNLIVENRTKSKGTIAQKLMDIYPDAVTLEKMPTKKYEDLENGKFWYDYEDRYGINDSYAIHHQLATQDNTRMIIALNEKITELENLINEN